MTWIIKVGDEYLSWHDGGSAGCSGKQRDAVRFGDQGKAYRVAARTFGLLDADALDEEMGARVVKLVTPFRVATVRRSTLSKGEPR